MKYFIILLLTLTSPVMAIGDVITFNDIQEAYNEDPDRSSRVLGGGFAYKEICNVEFTDLGKQSMDLVTPESYFFQEGYSIASDKIDTWGCWMAGIVVKKNLIGKTFFVK